MNGPPQATGQQSGNRLSSLIRPEQVARLANLDDRQKFEITNKVQNLWTYLTTPANQNDPQYEQAMKNLQNLSGRLIAGARQFMQANKAQQQQAALARTNAAAGQNQNGIQPQQQNGMVQQQHSGAVGGQIAPSGQQGQPKQSGAEIFGALQPNIQQKVMAHKFFFPPAMQAGTPQADEWLQEARARFGQALQKIQLAQSKRSELEGAVASRVAEGKPLNETENGHLNTKLAQCEKLMNEAQTFMRKFQDQQNAFRAGQNSAVNANNMAGNQRFANQNNAQGLRASEGNPSAGNQVAQGTPQQQNPAHNPQAYSIASAQAAARLINPTSVNSPVDTKPTPPRQNTSGGTSGDNSTAATPMDAQPLTQPNPLNNAPRPGTANAQPGVMRMPVQRQDAPPAVPTTDRPPQPSSMQNPNAPSHAHPNGRPYTSGQDIGPPPIVAHAGVKAGGPAIPKQMQTTAPTPVQMPPSRPTLMGGASDQNRGVLSQPALSTFPGYVLESSEDGHVLSKKKMYELVREVVGPDLGTEVLSPDCEEILLKTLDDFIDDLITAGCRLSKLRGGNTLEARDIQIVLERQYNIRIPGYATDENRVFKRNGPAPGWINKLNAVASAKVVNASSASNGRDINMGNGA